MMDKRIEENHQNEKETPQNVDGENFQYSLSAFFEWVSVCIAMHLKYHAITLHIDLQQIFSRKKYFLVVLLFNKWNSEFMHSYR